MLWIGIVIIGLLVGRYLPTSVVLAIPGLIIGLGFVATASTSAADSQRGLAVYVAVLLAAVAAVAEAVGRLARRRRASL
jgi:uncharacterized membrane protein (UPF0136 family)